MIRTFEVAYFAPRPDDADTNRRTAGQDIAAKLGELGVDTVD